MPSFKLNQKNKSIEVSEIEIENDIVFNYFDNLPAKKREETFVRALYIGVLALMEDRISSFLAKTTNELGTELESLKLVFDMKKELFYKTSIKGMLAEDDVNEFLNIFFKEKKLQDRALLTGNHQGELPENKTGDIVCEVDGNSELKIVIEVKFDKSLKLGDIKTNNVFKKKTDTAWSQLLEAQVNRDARASIIVFDRELVDNSILNACDNVAFVKGVGFIAIVDSQKGDYRNLSIAYMLARDIAVNSKEIEIDYDFLELIINRILKDVNEIVEVKSLIEKNIDNNKEILKRLEKNILMMNFNKEYLSKFLEKGKFNRSDMLQFYLGEDVKDKYKLIQKEIDEA